FKDISGDSFVQGILKKVESEFQPRILPNKFFLSLDSNNKRIENDVWEYFLDGEWKTFFHPIIKFIEKETHYLISNTRDDSGNPKYVWNEEKNYFEGLSPEEYLKYKEDIMQALVNKSMKIYEDYDWDFPKHVNLRGPLNNFLIRL
ncbi:MAG: hypothetical protein P8X70_02000, partial [Nanoarchaeota archaeon]